MTARSKEWICGCWLAGIAGSNPAGDFDVFLVSAVCCQVEVSATGRSHYRGVLPNLLCLSEFSEPRQGGGLGQLGAVEPWKNKVLNSRSR